MMTPLEKEHYQIARSFQTRDFTRQEFIKRYEQEYPERPVNSINPSDYCENRNPRGAENFAKFMSALGRGHYKFIELSTRRK